MARRGRPIVIQWAADTRDYLRGMKNVERDTDDVADSLRDAAKDSDRFGRDFKDAMKTAEAQADRSGRKIEQDFDRVPGELGDIGAEAGEELQQNLAESIAQGDLSSVVSDSLAGLSGALKGPLGWAAGAVAGVVGFAFVKMREQAEEDAARVEEVLQALSDAIKGMYEQGILTATAFEQLEAATGWMTEAAPEIDEMAEAAGRFGINADAVASAAFLGGDAWAEQEAILSRALTDARETHGVYSEEYKTIQGIVATAQEWVDEAGTARKEAERTAGFTEATARALGLVDTNGDGIIDDQDKIADAAERTADATADTEVNIAAAARATRELRDGIGRIPTHIDITARVNWYDTGPGAAYVTRGNANYSPAHVSISNMYQAAYNEGQR